MTRRLRSRSRTSSIVRAKLVAVREIVGLTESDSAVAGRLLAARHAGERKRFPLLPAAYEDPARQAELVRDLLTFCEGVAARDDRGNLVGFLTSFESTPDPMSPMARYAPEQASLHLVHGHAVVGHVDPGRIYAAMFGELAEGASGRGLIDHVVHVPIGDPAIEAAWVALGFGRINAVAIRNLTPTDRPRALDVEVRLATSDELDVVDGLVDEEAVFTRGVRFFVRTVVTPPSTPSGTNSRRRSPPTTTRS